MATLVERAFNGIMRPFGYTVEKSASDGIGKFKALALQTANRHSMSEEEIKRLGLRKPTNISFRMLRSIARRDAVCRICINVIKKAVSQSQWEIRVKKEAPAKPEAYEAERKQVYELFEFMNPNAENLREVLDKVIDDLLTLDASGIEKVFSLDGSRLAALNAVDGATLRPVYNAHGELGNPAYLQFMNDKKVAEFSQDELVYLMCQPQNDVESFGYGLSPIESILLQVQAGLQADMHNIKHFSGDNIPPGVLDLGDISEAEALKFIALWDATVVGNTHAMKFVWGKSTGNKYTPFTGNNKDMQYVEYIDWLTRIKLATFGLTTLDANMLQDVNRATAQVQQLISESRGVRNMKHYIEEVMTRRVICFMGGDALDPANKFRYLEFKFIQAEDLKGKLIQAQVDEKYLKNFVVDPSEIRERDGYAPRPETTSLGEAISAKVRQRTLDKALPDEEEDDEVTEE